MANLLYRTSASATTPTSTTVKNAPLTNLEVDGNFKSINDDLANKPTLVGGGASGTWGISISGNAATVTNGVYTTATYPNPAWITSLDVSKLTGTATNPGWITSLDVVKLTGTIADPSWITSLNVSKLTGTIADPSWITSLNQLKVLPTQAGNANKALVTNGTTASWQTTGPVITDDSSTDTTQYLGMSRGTSGNWTATYVSSTKLYFNPSTGALNATDFNSLSDVSQKKNINNINDALDTVKQINGVEFEWVDGGRKSSGVIAQELEKILPHLVQTNDNGIKSVNYNGLIAYLVESIKQLSSRIEYLENK